MLAQPVSAGSLTVKIADAEGDLAKLYDPDTGSPKNGWGDASAIAQLGYLDMKSFCLAKKGNSFTFGMELCGDLPQVGTLLPYGINDVAWCLWIEQEPWTPDNPVQPLCWIMLWYGWYPGYIDSSYVAQLRDSATGAWTPLPFTVTGAQFQIEFSANSIGNLASFWWSAGVLKASGMGAGFQTDTTDVGAVPGQVYWDIPWPPV